MPYHLELYEFSTPIRRRLSRQSGRNGKRSVHKLAHG